VYLWKTARFERPPPAAKNSESVAVLIRLVNTLWIVVPVENSVSHVRPPFNVSLITPRNVRVLKCAANPCCVVEKDTSNACEKYGRLKTGSKPAAVPLKIGTSAEAT